MKLALCCFLILLAFSINCVTAYSRALYSLVNEDSTEYTLQCSNTESTSTLSAGKGAPAARRSGVKFRPPLVGIFIKISSYFNNPSSSSTFADYARCQDPYLSMKKKLHRELYGEKVDIDLKIVEAPSPRNSLSGKKTKTPLSSHPKGKKKLSNLVDDNHEDHSNFSMHHYPNGQIMRGELFNNKSMVHFPPREFIYRGFALLNITNDYMQTAINAFAILLEGTVTDVANLPPDYVLRSARTISMMKITREKLAMLWTVIKGNRSTAEITHKELEMYRPLFKYVNAREMGRLNLKNTKILHFIGTHAELNRHQVGVVASKYMQLNPKWSSVNYLNHMNNLLCGVPMNFMRKIPSEIYLQLSHQIFYHIRACDPLQRKFYLAMMTKTEALGKSYSWSARDVSRLGLLLAEVQGPSLAAINPEAMSGITAQVMMEIPAHNLEYLTDVQVQYLALKPLSVFARKMRAYSYMNSGACTYVTQWNDLFLLMILLHKIL